MNKVFIVAVVTACLVHTASVVALFICVPQCRVHARNSRSINRLSSSSVVVATSSSRLAATAVSGGGSPCRIKVIGVGGGGGNVVNRMIQTSPSGSTSLDLGVEMWVINTDAQVTSNPSFPPHAAPHFSPSHDILLPSLFFPLTSLCLSVACALTGLVPQ